MLLVPLWGAYRSINGLVLNSVVVNYLKIVASIDCRKRCFMYLVI